MVDLNNVVQGLSKSGAVSGFAGGLAGTALAGALSGKKGKKMATSALKVGALAAVGGLAYSAWQRHKQQQPADNHGNAGLSPAFARAPAAKDHPDRWAHLERARFEAAVDESNAATGGLLLVRAMVAAAVADGHMNREEQDRIFREADRPRLAPEEKATLFDELRHPLSLDELARHVPDPETAIEVYAASLVAIDETRPEARTYLRRLAQTLELPESLVLSLHAQADAARPAEAA